MRDTAEALERSEATLHDSAESSRDESTRARLHALGDAVTREARRIDDRADAIAPTSASLDERASRRPPAV